MAGLPHNDSHQPYAENVHIITASEFVTISITCKGMPAATLPQTGMRG